MLYSSLFGEIEWAALFLIRFVLQMVMAGNGKSDTGVRDGLNVIMVEVVHWIQIMLMNHPDKPRTTNSTQPKKMLHNKKLC